MHMLKVAWSDESVMNCFAKAGFDTPTTPVEEEALDPPDGMLSSEFQAYVDFDMSLECHGQLTEEDICAQNCRGMGRHHSRIVMMIKMDHTSASCSQVLTLKSREAMQAMYTIRHFLEKSGADLQ